MSEPRKGVRVWLRPDGELEGYETAHGLVMAGHGPVDSSDSFLPGCTVHVLPSSARSEGGLDDLPFDDLPARTLGDDAPLSVLVLRLRDYMDEYAACVCDYDVFTEIAARARALEATSPASSEEP